MELLQTIKLFSIPLWVKVIIAILLVLLGTVNTIIFAYGVIDADREDLVKSSIELLSVLLPMFILALLLWKSSAGVDGLKRKTEEFFLTLLPDSLSRIHEIDSRFIEATSSAALSKRKLNPHVYTNLRKGECYADVITFIPDGDRKFIELAIRLEINVRRVNLGIYLARDVLDRLYWNAHPNEAQSNMDEGPDLRSISRWVFTLFGHTMGAHHKSRNVDLSEQASDKIGVGDDRSDERTGPLVYSFNSTLLCKTIRGRRYYQLVASTAVQSDFLWDPSERLFFAQDILFFLRGFVAENATCFRRLDEAELHLEVKKLQSVSGGA